MAGEFKGRNMYMAGEFKRRNTNMNEKFRELRRFKQALTEEETKRVLYEGKTGILAVCGEHGYPYTVPINYVYDGEKIYLHGARQGHKIDSIQKNEKVSFCVIDKDDVVAEELTTYFRSVVIFGRARILESEQEVYEAALKLVMKYLPDEEKNRQEISRFLKVMTCIEITIDHMSGKQAKELIGSKQG